MDQLVLIVKSLKEDDLTPIYKRKDDDAALSLDVALAELDSTLSQQQRLDFALSNGLIDLSEVNATSNAKLNLE